MPLDNKDYSASVARTLTPILVGLILGVLGTEIVGVNEASLTPVVSGVITAIYYALVRALEQKWPKVGVLLGWPSAPTYSKPSDGQ